MGKGLGCPMCSIVEWFFKLIMKPFQILCGKGVANSDTSSCPTSCSIKKNK